MKHRTRHITLIPTLLLAATLGMGCDGAEVSTTPTGTPDCTEPGRVDCDDEESFTLSPEQVIAELDHGELIALCEVSREFNLTRHQLLTDGALGCTGDGLRAQFSFGEDADASICEGVRDECLEALQAEIGNRPSSPKYVLSCESQDVSPLPMLGCDITVADYQVCLDAILAPMVFDKETFICGMAREDAMTYTPPEPTQMPPECDSTQSLCPALIAMIEG